MARSMWLAAMRRNGTYFHLEEVGRVMSQVVGCGYTLPASSMGSRSCHLIPVAGIRRYLRKSGRSLTLQKMEGVIHRRKLSER